MFGSTSWLGRLTAGVRSRHVLQCERSFVSSRSVLCFTYGTGVVSIRDGSNADLHRGRDVVRRVVAPTVVLYTLNHALSNLCFTVVNLCAVVEELLKNFWWGHCGMSFTVTDYVTAVDVSCAPLNKQFTPIPQANINRI